MITDEYRSLIRKEIKKCRERIDLLNAAENEYSLFCVTTEFEDRHSGDMLQSKQNIWAYNAKDAEYKATVNRDGIRYATVVGWTLMERGVPVYIPETGEVQ